MENRSFGGTVPLRLTPRAPLPNIPRRGAVAQLAERRVRNAEARSSTLLCSTICFQPFTAAGNGGCFGQGANTWKFFLEFNFSLNSRGLAQKKIHRTEGFRMQRLRLTRPLQIECSRCPPLDIHVPKPVEPAELVTVIASLSSRVVQLSRS